MGYELGHEKSVSDAIAKGDYLGVCGEILERAEKCGSYWWRIEVMVQETCSFATRCSYIGYSTAWESESDPRHVAV